MQKSVLYYFCHVSLQYKTQHKCIYVSYGNKHIIINFIVSCNIRYNKKHSHGI